MKHFGKVFAAVFALVATQAVIPAKAADPSIYGIWARDGKKDKMEFFDCEGKLCARGIIPMPDGSEQPLVLRHAPKSGPAQWHGELFNPQDGKTYTGTITWDKHEKLTLKGCLIAFLCQSETWTKIGPPPSATGASAAAGAAPGKAAAKVAPAKTNGAKPANGKPVAKPEADAPPAEAEGAEAQ